MVDAILDYFRGVRAGRLAVIRELFIRALMDGDQTAAASYATERRSLLDWPELVAGIDEREALLSAWPPTLPPLPLYLRAPEEAAALDPPGAPVSVDCSTPSEEPTT